MLRVSVFDLDRTLFKINASFRFGVYLYQHKVLSTPKMLILTSCYLAYKLRLLSMESLHKKIFNYFFLGQSLSTFESHAKSFLDTNFESFINLPVLEKLNLAKSKGHYTVLFSSSPDFLVQQIADRFKVHYWKGSCYKTDDFSQFVELDEIMTGPAKAQSLRSLIHMIGSSLSKCDAYSDSYEDLPLLELVGKPIVVNPDKRLHTFCRKKNWEMI